MSLALCSFKVPLNKTCELNPPNLNWGKYRVSNFFRKKNKTLNHIQKYV